MVRVSFRFDALPQAGQQFASCSAYFRYGASLARANGLDDSAVAIEGIQELAHDANGFLLVTVGG